MANEKLRYSDQELEEFRAIIDEKLKVAKQTYHDCMRCWCYRGNESF